MHTRRLDDPAAAFDRLQPLLRDLAERYGLVVEPGRNVIEVRSPGMDKGVVVRDLAEEVEAGGFLFAGDDLGDVEAFEAVAELRAQRPARPCWSARPPQEESALVELADVVVDGPDGRPRPAPPAHRRRRGLHDVLRLRRPRPHSRRRVQHVDAVYAC